MRLPVLAGAVCLLGIWLGGMAWWTDRGVRRVEDFSTIQPADPSIQEPWRTHRFFIDPDSYQWLAMARDLRAATGLGLIDRQAGACLYAVYGLGLRSHEAARQLRISPELVRWRNARSIRRLAPHAARLAAVA